MYFYTLTPPHPSRLNKDSLIVLSCSNCALAVDVAALLDAVLPELLDIVGGPPEFELPPGELLPPSNSIKIIIEMNKSHWIIILLKFTLRRRRILLSTVWL